MKNRTRTHRTVTALAATLITGGLVLATGPASGAAVLPAEVTPAQQQAMLAETNALRQQAGQPPLTWDDGLATASQAWADNPASTAGGELHHQSVPNSAENMSGYPPDQAVGSWAEEKAAYDADPDHDNSDSPGYQTWGHYYNMIDSKWHKMGCGAKNEVPIPGAGWVVVCRYGP